MKRKNVVLILESELIKAKNNLKDSEKGSVLYFQNKTLIAYLECTLKLLEKEVKK